MPTGVFYMVMSALSFSVMGLFVKIAGVRGFPIMEIVAARALVSVVLSWISLKQKQVPMLGTQKSLLVLRGLIGFVSLTAVYYALTELPFAEATVLQYLHPLFATVLALIFLKEMPKVITLASMAISLLGLLFVVRPGFLFGTLQAEWSWFAVMVAILGAFGSACAYVLVRHLSRTEDPLVIVLYFPMVSLPATLPFLWNDFLMPQGWEWLLLLGIGISTQVGQIALTKGLQLETASRATSFSYLQVVFAMIFGVMFFDEVPEVWTLIGALLILLGSWISARSR